MDHSSEVYYFETDQRSRPFFLLEISDTSGS